MDAMDAAERYTRGGLIVAYCLVTLMCCLAAMLLISLGFAAGEITVTTNATTSATATPPRNGSIRTWSADGHWWVVGDGWGVHHPGCPCHAKAEVQ